MWSGSFISFDNISTYSTAFSECSSTPTYRSTPPGSVGPCSAGRGPIQYASFSLAHNSSLLYGSVYRSSYHELPAHCGITLVSRVYGFSPSPRSSSTCTHSIALASGGDGSLSASSGSNNTGE